MDVLLFIVSLSDTYAFMCVKTFFEFRGGTREIIYIWVFTPTDNQFCCALPVASARVLSAYLCIKVNEEKVLKCKENSLRDKISSFFIVFILVSVISLNVHGVVRAISLHYR